MSRREAYLLVSHQFWSVVVWCKITSPVAIDHKKELSMTQICTALRYAFSRETMLSIVLRLCLLLAPPSRARLYIPGRVVLLLEPPLRIDVACHSGQALHGVFFELPLHHHLALFQIVTVL